MTRCPLLLRHARCVDAARGSDRTAAMYSPMATAKLNGLDSDAYLRTIKFF